MFDQQLIHFDLTPLQACGVDFEVKAYIANAPNNGDEVIEKKYVCPQHSMDMRIRFDQIKFQITNSKYTHSYATNSCVFFLISGTLVD